MASKNNETNQNNSKKKLAFIAVGALLLALSYLSPSDSDATDLGSKDMQLFEGPVAEGNFKNPEFSMWEKALCFGYKSASFCPDRALHPFIESRRENGKAYFDAKKPKRVTTVRYSDLVN